MLKSFSPLLVATLIFSSALKADEAVPTESEEVSSAKQTAPEENMTSAEAVITEVVPEPVVEVSESELIEMIGFLAAQGGGVPMLQLDDSGIAAITAGLIDGLTGAKKLEDFPQESMQEAFAEAKARAEAIEAEAEEIPEITQDSLKKIGFIMVMQSGLTQLGFGAEEAPLIQKGFINGAITTEPDPAMEAKMPAFQEFMQKRIAAIQAKAAAEAEALAAERIAAGKVFFEELAEDAEVQKSESGLHYKILEPGADEKPTLADSVLVHYKGTLIDGTKFDSSYDRGSPAEFPLSGVVKGFGEGLTKVGAGGKITLYIPSELGYGNSPRPGGVIKPGDTLIFECELIEVNPE